MEVQISLDEKVVYKLSNIISKYSIYGKGIEIQFGKFKGLFVNEISKNYYECNQNIKCPQYYMKGSEIIRNTQTNGWVLNIDESLVANNSNGCFRVPPPLGVSGDTIYRHAPDSSPTSTCPTDWSSSNIQGLAGDAGSPYPAWWKTCWGGGDPGRCHALITDRLPYLYGNTYLCQGSNPGGGDAVFQDKNWVHITSPQQNPIFSNVPGGWDKGGWIYGFLGDNRPQNHIDNWCYYKINT